MVPLRIRSGQLSTVSFLQPAKLRLKFSCIFSRVTDVRRVNVRAPVMTSWRVDKGEKRKKEKEENYGWLYVKAFPWPTNGGVRVANDFP